MTLPKGWVEEPLGKYIDFKKKSQRKAGEGKEKGEYKFFTSSDVQKKFFDEYDYEGEHLIFGTGGGASIHFCDEKFSTSTDCFIVSVSDEIKTKYVYYFIRGHIHLLEAGFKGAGLKHVSKDHIRELPISFPVDIKIQEKIVTMLEKAEQIKEWRKEADDLSKDYLKSLFVEMFGDPILNPKKWNKKPLGKLCRIRRGASPRPISNFVGGTVPWIKIGDATKGNELYIEKTAIKIIEEGVSKSVFLKSGSLVFANCGVSLGFARILKIDGCIHDGWLSMEEFKPELDQIYLLKLINHITQYLRDAAPDGTQPNLNSGIMKELEIILPPVELQRRFSKIVMGFEALKELQLNSKWATENFFLSSMSKAFKGELV